MLQSDMYPDKKEYWIMEQIQQTRYVQKQLIDKGAAALSEFDKDKGIDWAKQKMQEQLDYFVSRLKETISEKEFLKYLKDNNIKQTIK